MLTRFREIWKACFQLIFLLLWSPFKQITSLLLPLKLSENMAAFPPLESKAPFQEVISWKETKSLETVINTCVSLIKQHLDKMAGIPQKRDFPTSTIQIFVRKVKQFVRKYYITWLIDLANNLWRRKIYWFYFMSCVIKIVLFY